MSDLEVAQDAEDKAQVDVATAAEHLRVLGNDPDHPSGIVNIYAPISGVITDQEITNAAGVQGLSSPNPFTISDLSYVWVLCDVHEPDLLNVHVGETADIQLAADPNLALKGTIDNVGSILDPAIRTAKVRIELRNPGIMRPGMFATVTFHGSNKEMHAAVRPRLFYICTTGIGSSWLRVAGNSDAWKLPVECRFRETCRKSSPASNRAREWFRARCCSKIRWSSR
jgi:cobalt-zinc-cadmium efflux system membrane fusion protein